MKKTDTPMVVVAPDRARQDEMYEFIAKVFSHRGYFTFRDYCRDRYIGHSRYDWAASRVGLIDNQMVTHWGVWDYSMRIGACTVRAAGIGVVATHGDFRNRGLMAKTAQPSIDAMKPLGYDMTLLFGIWNFYHRFGYVRAWPDVKHVIAAGLLPPQKPQRAAKKFTPAQRDDLDRLYNRYYANLTGTAVRPTYDTNRYPEKWNGVLWESGGKAEGYIVYGQDGKLLDVIEAVGEVDQCLRTVSALCRKFCCSEAAFTAMPYEHPIARRLRQGNCRVESNYTANGGPMVHMINLASTLTKIAPELSRRLKASCFADWRGALLIEDPREKALLKIDRGRVTTGLAAATPHAIRGGEHIAQLVIGTHDTGDTIEGGKIKLTGAAAALAPILFPNQHPILGLWDHY